MVLSVYDYRCDVRSQVWIYDIIETDKTAESGKRIGMHFFERHDPFTGLKGQCIALSLSFSH